LTKHRAIDVRVRGRFGGKLLVEVRSIALVEYGRFEGGFVFAVEEFAPVDRVEEGVCLESVLAVFPNNVVERSVLP